MIIGINGYAGSGKDTVGKIIQYLTSEAITKGRSFEMFLERSSNPDAFGNWYWSTWEIKRFANKLKQIASILLGIPSHKFEDREFKSSKLPREWSTQIPLWVPEEEMRIMRDLHHSSLKVEDFATSQGYIKGIDDVYPDYYVKTDRYQDITVREFMQKLGTEAIRDGLHTDTWVNALFADYREEFVIDKKDTVVSAIDKYPNWIITDMRMPNEYNAVLKRKGIVIRVNRGEPVNQHPTETALDNHKFDYVIDNNGTIEELISKVKTILADLKLLTPDVKENVSKA